MEKITEGIAAGRREIATPDSADLRFRNLRVAIVHHWFVNRRGGERAVEAMAEIFPQADLYTLVLDRTVLSPALKSRNFTTSFLQKLPGATRYYKKLLPLFPLALEQFRLDDYDLVISSESGPAKGVITSPRTCHICYCNTPMRYLWDMTHAYQASTNPLLRPIVALGTHYVRVWDLATASRVDYFVANSNFVASRIRKYYRRESHVIYPPVSTSNGYIADHTGDFYLVVSPLVAYKRVDMAIEACNRLGRPLRVIGTGEEFKRFRRLAGPTVQMLGYAPIEDLRQNYAECRALLFPGEEDFGLVPVEAQSYGRPVIAYGRGGALETVAGFYPGDSCDPQRSTGVFFRQQSVESLIEAIKAFEAIESQFSPPLIRAQTERFDVARFKTEMSEFVAEKISQFSATGP